MRWLSGMHSMLQQVPTNLDGRLLLEVNRLAKRFGRRQVLDGVSFSVGRGHIHGLLGPNGAGKTTVLRMLLGMVTPDAGSITLAGRVLAADVPRGRCRIAGFVESPSFYPT